jgi:hypothetical protein
MLRSPLKHAQFAGGQSEFYSLGESAYKRHLDIDLIIQLPFFRGIARKKQKGGAELISLIRCEPTQAAKHGIPPRFFSGQGL